MNLLLNDKEPIPRIKVIKKEENADKYANAFFALVTNKETEKANHKVSI